MDGYNNFYYENQGSNVFLVHQFCETEDIDTMSLGMLTTNNIPGLAATSFMQVDTTKYIKYNVSAKVSAAQLFSGPVNKKRLIGVFTGIADAMLSIEDYMIDPQTILLDLDYIFTDVSTCETVMICLPVTNMQNDNKDLSAFLKNIIFKTQFDQTENCDHVVKILNFLNSNSTISLSDFKSLLEKIMQGESAQTASPPKTQTAQPAVKVQPVVQQPPVQSPVQQKPITADKPTPVPQPAVQKVATPPVQQNAKTAPEEKPMTMFYLLQHYSKENAAKYKAQQETKKAQKSSAAEVTVQKPNHKVPPKTVDTGFAVPGQQSSQVNPRYTTPAQPEVPTERKPVQQPQTTAYQPPAAQPATPISFGETTVLGGGQIGETTVLGAVADPSRVDPHLIRTKNNEKIPLNKPVFRIGKERSYVDYFIGDNTAISRSHANIVNRNGEFFVVDTNSTNHTYVNGGMIQSNVETKLSHGTKIRLANEDFEFRMY